MGNDKLALMLQKQKELQERLGYDFSNMSVEQRVELIKEHSIHATQELHEMLYELPFFKPWKDYSGMNKVEQAVGMDKGKEEFIDFLHFSWNIALLLGFTPDEIFNRYYYKNAENHKRQDEGYTHDKSFR